MIHESTHVRFLNTLALACIASSLPPSFSLFCCFSWCSLLLFLVLLCLFIFGSLLLFSPFLPLYFSSVPALVVSRSSAVLCLMYLVLRALLFDCCLLPKVACGLRPVSKVV